MPATDIQKLSRDSLQTWEQAFENVDKTSDAFHKLVDEFVEFVGDWGDLTDKQREDFADLIKNLDSVQNHWEDINGWIKENTNKLREFTGSLSDIRAIFQDISSEVGGIKRQTLDRVNITRQLASLANDSIAAARQEGGLSERTLAILDRRKTRTDELYKAQLRSLGVLKENGDVDESQANKVFREHENKANQLSRQIRHLKKLRDVDHVAIPERQIRFLEEQVKYHQMIAELVNDTSIKAEESLMKQIDLRKELYRQEKKASGSNKVRVVSRILKKVGLSEEAVDLEKDFGEYVTNRVTTKENRRLAEESLRAAENERNITQKKFGISNYSYDAKLDRFRGEKGRFIVLPAELAAAERIVNTSREALDLAKKAAKEAEEPFGVTTRIKAVLSDIPKLLQKIGILIGIALYRHLLDFNKQAVETKRVIGQWADVSATANTKFVAGTEVLKTMVQLGQQFKINPVQVFSPEELARITQAQKFTGMTAEAAGNLAIQSKISGKNADTYRDAIAKGANSANTLNHSAINLSAVQNDVLTTSRAIALSYGKSTAELAKAAGTAASLNMNLEQIQEISRSLMNFESSISAEMEAQLLTGMQLNLAKAREYALNNDLNGVAREIANQGMNAAKFSHMNYIQQESMAKALGMSREQMAKMLIMQEINSGLTAKQVAAMTGMRRQDIEALSAQEKWQTMKQKFLESLVPLLEPILQLTTDILIPVTRFVLGPITILAGLISKIGGLVEESNVFVRGLVGLVTIGLVAGLTKVVSLTGIIGKTFKGIANFGKIIGKSIASWVTGLNGATRSAFVKAPVQFQKRGLADLFSGKTRDYQGRTARQRLRDTRNLEKAEEINPAGAAATSRASASMGSAISKIGKNIGKIALGAAAAVMVAGAVFILAKAAQEFMKVSWGGMAKAIVGLIALVGGVAALGALMSSGIGTVLILAGAAAMAVMAGSVLLLGHALKQISTVSGDELQSISTGIRSIAGAIGELSGKLGDLSVNKLNRLGKVFKKLKNANIPIYVEAQSEIPRESQETTRDSIEASAKEIVIKTAQVQASAQQISVEQKAADLTKIEEKMNSIKKAIEDLPRIMEFSEFDRRYQLG